MSSFVTTYDNPSAPQANFDFEQNQSSGGSNLMNQISWSHNVNQDAEDYYLVGGLLGDSTDTDSGFRPSFGLFYHVSNQESDAAKDLLFYNTGYTPNTHYTSDTKDGGRLSYPVMAFDPNNKGRVFTTGFSMDPRRGGSSDDELYIWGSIVREHGVPDDAYNQFTKVWWVTNQKGGYYGANTPLGPSEGTYNSMDLRALATAADNNDWNTVNNINFNRQMNNYPAVANAGTSKVTWESKNTDHSSSVFTNPSSDVVYWYEPLMGPNQLSNDINDIGSNSGTAKNCMGSDADWGKCQNFYNSFYNQPSLNATSCSTAPATWNKMLGPTRSSAIDGAEMGNSVSKGFFRYGFDTPTQIGCSLTDPNVPNKYTCSGFYWYPISIEGLQTLEPGPVGKNSTEHWTDVRTLSRNVETSPNTCLVSNITLADGNISGKWSNTGCPRVVPEAFTDNACSGKSKSCPSTTLVNNPNARHPTDCNDIAYRDAEIWFQTLLTKSVIPLATQLWANETAPDGTDLATYYIKNEWTWEKYFGYIQGKYQNGDTSAGTKFCTSPYYLDFFSPLPVRDESISINWWAEWAAVGITEQKVIDMMVGAVPVSYLLNKFNYLSLLPVYFVGSFCLMVFTNNYTNTGIKDSIEQAIAKIRDLYDTAWSIWYDNVDPEVQNARAFLKKVATYGIITMSGLFISFLAIRGTSVAEKIALYANPAAAAANSEIMSSLATSEILIGFILTALADLLYAAYNGDLTSLFHLITSGKSITQAIWDSFQNAFNF